MSWPRALSARTLADLSNAALFV